MTIFYDHQGGYKIHKNNIQFEAGFVLKMFYENDPVICRQSVKEIKEKCRMWDKTLERQGLRTYKW